MCNIPAQVAASHPTPSLLPLHVHGVHLTAHNTLNVNSHVTGPLHVGPYQNEPVGIPAFNQLTWQCQRPRPPCRLPPG